MARFYQKTKPAIKLQNILKYNFKADLLLSLLFICVSITNLLNPQNSQGKDRERS